MTDAPSPFSDAEEARIKELIAMAVANDRLNLSEALMRDRLGNEPVDELIDRFKCAVEAEPSLQQELLLQPHPYLWAFRRFCAN